MKAELSIKKSLYVIIGSIGVFAILIYQTLRQESSAGTIKKQVNLMKIK